MRPTLTAAALTAVPWPQAGERKSQGTNVSPSVKGTRNLIALSSCPRLRPERYRSRFARQTLSPYGYRAGGESPHSS
ncbi:MAG: hypothetical protein LBR80_05510 [Deltaproteobacteria bacterium]|nr:hypothetical protein [Deltaproteobacteria bacterium]